MELAGFNTRAAPAPAALRYESLSSEAWSAEFEKRQVNEFVDASQYCFGIAKVGRADNDDAIGSY